MKRYPDWQLRFEALVRSRMATRFAWGVHDCALFAADDVEALTGERLCDQLRVYRDERTALELLQAHGGLRGIAALALGEPVAPVLARVGDVVLADAGGRDSLGVCNGGSVLVPGPDGLVARSLRDAHLAWKVG